MADQYNLEDLLKNQPQLPATVMNQEEAEKITQADFKPLAPEEREKVDSIKDSLDLRDSSMSSLYGTATQKNMAEFSDSILDQVKSRDAGDVGEMLTDLLVKVKNGNPAESQGFFTKLFRNGKMQMDKVLTSYESLSGQIDQLSAQLQDQQKDLMKQVQIFDQLYQQNLKQYKDLELYIIAGEEKVREMREEVLPDLYAQAKASDNPMAVQVVSDLEANVDRFERKVHELKISQTLALQAAPQIKLIQNNDQLLVDKINDVVNNTIPLWRSQTVIALGLAKQESALQMQRDVSETTNALIRENAKKLKQTTLGIKEESERSIVDVEALEQANKDLIDTINGSVEISKQAKVQRAAAEEKMVHIKEDLRVALQNALDAEQGGSAQK